MINETSVGELLKHAQPDLILDKLSSPVDGPWQKLYKWRRMKEIADGDVVDKEEHEEHVYEGHMNARDLGEWLLQWDGSWAVWTSDDGEVWINRYVVRPLSEAEIEEAVKYIEENPEPPEQAPIKWRATHAIWPDPIPEKRTNFSTDDWT